MRTATVKREQKIYVRPAESKRLGCQLQVRQPEREGRPLPSEGAWVPRNGYWLSALRVSDVIETSPPRKPKKADGAAKSNEE